MRENLDDDGGVFNGGKDGQGAAALGQVVRSMAKTRLSNWAQLLRARVEAAGDAPSSLEEAVARSASPGTIWERRAALGASTPWKRRGDGVGDAGRAPRGVGGIPAGS